MALAASAGGLKALEEVLSGLPDDLDTAIVIVLHLDPRHRSLMASILDRYSKLRVKEAQQGDKLEAGVVYTAAPDAHLLVNPDETLSLSHSESVHFLGPSADLLFESVAASFRDRAIGVVLTGTGGDGATGVRAIKKMGGRVIAQNGATSDFFGMPGAAINTGQVDYVLPLEDIAAALVRLVQHKETHEQRKRRRHRDSIEGAIIVMEEVGTTGGA
jgi:two-component system chemotaxis response regulator CheB